MVAAIKKEPEVITGNIEFPVEVLNACKIEILTALLKCIKHIELSTAHRIVNVLVDSKVKWSELDIIKRSLYHDLERTKITHIPQDHDDMNDDLNLNESFDSLTNIKYYLDQYDIIGAIMEMKTYKLTVSNTPSLRVVLEKYKSDIIRFLLERFKNHINSTHHIIKLEFTISDLISTGIGWPELSTILNGVQSQRIIDMKHR